MSYLVWLIPIAILMGIAALATFLWSLRDGQYEDLDGAAARILVDEDRPIQESSQARA
ncbi:cbb3-type cytochrome oxidase assembly protein CcoS [Chelativorans sp. AA-79]|uniref:cbb3-type cytochrome oxidase assembly protein CcoS n=1 Tax=Chelativorans sp. AA-79 TaxID=3028735 RepID=UPI0023F68BA2|nr:cbb3-type cytochrome oxidase assembly protein CcoS [Chelativorans sp. AA-79]WEX10814.1 cbb3-type cytochrome oxidase assembly protein CcoS [Chelativorans sp. AA-79]